MINRLIEIITEGKVSERSGKVAGKHNRMQNKFFEFLWQRDVGMLFFCCWKKSDLFCFGAAK